MADGCHIVNHKIAISQQYVVRFLWNLVHNSTAYLELEDSQVTKCYFFKFNMADGHRIKNRFWQSQQPVARF